MASRDLSLSQTDVTDKCKISIMMIVLCYKRVVVEVSS